ncbi:transposase [Pedobacter helvus]|uniref:IS110 family transposase n=1 Tax=Pedobacter helvus TaxID=2563444 RepID=A0ABW9JLJ0_9SPHI|nr:transposase [Pedobacter ureilyticus]
MNRLKNSRYTLFIGIDVSKLTLDVAILKCDSFVQHYQIGNNTTAIITLLEELTSKHKMVLSKAVFGMEHTGIYCMPILDVLLKRTANIVLQDAGHLKKSMGTIRGKDDKSDALRIAAYLIKNRDHLVLLNAKRKVLDDLGRLSTLRDRMVSVRHALSVPLKEEKRFNPGAFSETLNSICADSLTALENDLKKLEIHVESIWKNDERLNKLMNLITSVPGVGPITAIRILVSTNEFITINNPRKFACYCGVAPFNYSSGTSIKGRTKTSKIANRKLKSLIHICAVSAKRFVPEISTYYERKTAEGKHKMSVMNAIRFKIIGRIFSCVNRSEPYRENYVPANLKTIKNTIT